jgi:hypothetical protein
MNIRVGDGTPAPFPMKHLQDPVIVNQMQEAALNAVLDGYTHLVYNFIRSGDTVLQVQDECTFQPFDLSKLWEEQSESRRMAKLKTTS